VQAIA
jgi:hypothetical protein